MGEGAALDGAVPDRDTLHSTWEAAATALWGVVGGAMWTDAGLAVDDAELARWRRRQLDALIRERAALEARVEAVTGLAAEVVEPPPGLLAAGLVEVTPPVAPETDTGVGAMADAGVAASTDGFEDSEPNFAGPGGADGGVRGGAGPDDADGDGGDGGARPSQAHEAVALWPASDVELTDADAVAAFQDALTRRRAALHAEVSDWAAIEDTLTKSWQPDAPEEPAAGLRRSREPRQPAVEAADSALAAVRAARIEQVQLRRELALRELALVEASWSYLGRSQPARRAARELVGESARAIAAAAERAERDVQAAADAEQAARSEQARAASRAEATLSAERARLYYVQQEQGRFEQQVVLAYRQTVVDERDSLGAERDDFIRRVEAAVAAAEDDAEDEAEDDDERALARARERTRAELHDQLRAALARARLVALPEIFGLLTGLAPAPRPGSLRVEVRALPDEYEAGRAELEELRSALSKRARTYEADLRELTQERVRLYYEHITDLYRARVTLWQTLPETRRDMLASPLSERTQAQLWQEVTQAAVGAAYWLNRRGDELGAGLSLLRDYGTLGRALWWIFDIALILFVLRFCLRRWDGWMLRAVELIGTALPVGPWTLFLARLFEFARSFGPALLWLVAIELVYWQLGGDAEAPPEARILHSVGFWFATFRVQMRLVERITAVLESRTQERARESAEFDEVELDHARGDGNARNDGASAGARDGAGDEARRASGAASAAEDPPTQAAVNAASLPRAPISWKLVRRVWRLLSGYLGVVLIVRALITVGMGEALVYALFMRIVLWIGIALAGAYIHIHRKTIAELVVTYLKPGSKLTQLIASHGHRFYGAALTFVALSIVVITRLTIWARDEVANLDAAKRLLAFMFRRRVEKHAAEHGRVLERVEVLPQDLRAAFPAGALTPSDRPVKTKVLAEIRDAFAAWQEQRVQGSVVIVGARGMGKSTVLSMLESELGAPITSVEVTTKYVESAALIAALGGLLELAVPAAQGGEETIGPVVFSSEEDLIQAIRDQGPRIMALDGCHNFFLRQVDGFRAWETFTRVVNQTCEQVFWVLGFNDVAWDYLANIAGGVAYFRRVVKMPPWTDEELRRLILTRMRRAGYRSNFTDLLVTNIEGVGTRAQIIRTSRGYFRLLWDFTAGNPRIATHFWLRSLVPDEESRTARVHLFAAPRMQALEALSDDMAFVLTAVVEHENIDVDELAAVSNLSPDFCRFAVDYCCEHGYLVLDPSTARVRLSIHWQQSIIRYLRRRHLLYS
ncbi:MAG: hypothetical protein Tsb0020_15640 [Haliangiales bacterium]